MRSVMLQRATPEQALIVHRWLIGVLLVAAFLGMAGGTWDAAWHVSRQREGLFSPPHLLLYSSTTIALVTSAAGLLAAWVLRWPFPGPTLSLRRPVPIGLALAALGAFIVIGSAPLDEFWHRTFGRDVDVWSFPHVLALFGGVGIDLGAIVAVAADRGALGRTAKWHRLASLGFLVVLTWVAMFSLNWYTLVLALLRDSVQYPVLACMVSAPVLIIGALTLGRGGATATALSSMVVIEAMHLVISRSGFALLPIPPLLLFPAVAVDLVLWAHPTPGWTRAAIAAALVAPLFYAAEAASLTWLPHPGLSVPTDPLALSYYEAVVNRPWDLPHVAASLPVALLIGTLTGLGGWWIGATIQWVQGLRTAPGPMLSAEVGQVGGLADHVGDRALRVQVEDRHGRGSNAEAPVGS
jgi:hypothetical protein